MNTPRSAGDAISLGSLSGAPECPARDSFSNLGGKAEGEEHNQQVAHKDVVAACQSAAMCPDNDARCLQTSTSRITNPFAPFVTSSLGLPTPHHLHALSVQYQTGTKVVQRCMTYAYLENVGGDVDALLLAHHPQPIPRQDASV